MNTPVNKAGDIPYAINSFRERFGVNWNVALRMITNVIVLFCKKVKREILLLL